MIRKLEVGLSVSGGGDKEGRGRTEVVVRHLVEHNAADVLHYRFGFIVAVGRGHNGEEFLRKLRHRAV